MYEIPGEGHDCLARFPVNSKLEFEATISSQLNPIPKENFDNPTKKLFSNRTRNEKKLIHTLMQFWKSLQFYL